MTTPRLGVLAAVVIATLAACSGDDSATPDTTDAASTSAPTTVPTPDTSAPGTSGPETTVTTITPATTPATTTTAPATTAPATTPTTTPATTAPGCEPIGDTSDERESFPERMSALIGADIRTGGHECFERIVIELQESDLPAPQPFPGWWVRYADGPITLGQTDDQFVDLLGDETLLITANSWMFYPDVGGYEGPNQIFPTNVGGILELLLIDNYEGQHTWAVGLDSRRAFRADELADPPRLVIDIAL